MNTFLAIARCVGVLLEALILFNFVIMVHELGHFCAARRRGLVIEKFGIWFGKPIFKRRIKGIDFQLGWIPAGGFVSLPQLANPGAVEGKSKLRLEDLPKATPTDKIVAAVGGPAFSFLLALLFAVVVWAVGQPTVEAEITAFVGYVERDSPAAAAGIKAGDQIVEVDGKPVSRFTGLSDSVIWQVVRSEGKTIPFVVLRGDQRLVIEVPPAKRTDDRAVGRPPLRAVDIYPILAPRVAKVTPGSPAEKAGLRPGDLIRSINQQQLWHPYAIDDLVQTSNGAPLRAVIKRGEADVICTILPERVGDNRYRIGVNEWSQATTQIVHPGPIAQVTNSVRMMVQTVQAVASHKSEVQLKHLSGPVGIYNLYYRLFQRESGWRLAFWFSVVLNVNLSIVNMLPIPVLDGGHVVLALIEHFRGRPMNQRVLNFVQGTFAAVIFAYVIFVTVYDSIDLVNPAIRR